jgi:hypothetical protein
MFVADKGPPGWMDRVEKMKESQMDSMIKIAPSTIQASGLQLDGPQSNNGTHMGKNSFAKLRSKGVNSIGRGKALHA